jgi:cytochrome c-type biogenesis protein CcmI
MTSFLICALVIIFCLLALLSVGVARSKQTINDPARRLAVFRDRKLEISADQRSGRLTTSEAEQAIDDLSKQLQHEAQDLVTGDSDHMHPPTAPKAERTHWVWLMASAMGSLLIGVAAYGYLGAPELTEASFRNSFERAQSETKATEKPTAAQLQEAILELEQLAKTKPNDPAVWGSLGRAYRMNNNPNEAVKAYAKSKELGLSSPDFLVDYAESMAASKNGDFSGEPMAMLSQALKQSPDLPKAVALMGAAQFRLGNLKEARVYLVKTLEALPPGSPQAQAVQGALNQIDGKPATEAKLLVKGSISLSPELFAALKAMPADQGAIFLALRSEDKPMPLAAIKLKLSQARAALLAGEALPFEINDSQLLGPLPAATPKSVGFLATVRISLQGTATKTKGDLFGNSQPISDLLPATGANAVQVKIDQVTP